jgi:hypothetical protein
VDVAMSVREPGEQYAEGREPRPTFRDHERRIAASG